MENDNPLTPAPPEPPVPMALPSDLKTVFLGGIFLLFLLCVLKTASEIIMPMLLALILKLVFQPVQRMLERLHIPRVIAALLILTLLIGALAGFGTLITGPASAWLEKLPTALPRLQERIGFLSDPLEEAQKLVMRAEDLTHATGPAVVPVAVQGTRLSDKLFTGTRAFLSGFFTTMLMLFFLLASGDTFLRKIVEILPTFKDKRQAVDLSQQIERNLSAYLLTITVMNAGMGVVTGLIMAACGMGDPILWGALAFLLNYVPIIGTLIAAVLFLVAGLLTIADPIWAFAPALFYLLARFIEGTFLTPILVARRFTLNPVLVMFSLIFWYWMWGFPGAILAMPMLAITKIICDRIQKLSAFGHFLGG